MVAGASYKEEDIDSANDQGFQTLMFATTQTLDFLGDVYDVCLAQVASAEQSCLFLSPAIEVAIM